MQSKKYSDQELLFIVTLKENSSDTWEEITEKFNEKFGTEANTHSITQTYHRYKDSLS